MDGQKLSGIKSPCPSIQGAIVRLGVDFFSRNLDLPLSKSSDSVLTPLEEPSEVAVGASYRGERSGCCRKGQRVGEGRQGLSRRRWSFLTFDSSGPCGSLQWAQIEHKLPPPSSSSLFLFLFSSSLCLEPLRHLWRHHQPRGRQLLKVSEQHQRGLLLKEFPAAWAPSGLHRSTERHQGPPGSDDSGGGGRVRGE